MSQKVFNGNNIELLKEYPDNYFDAIVTDPPYGLGKEPNAEQMLQAWITDGYLEVKGSGFMGKEWDAFVPQPIFWKEVFRVLKPGGHILSFFGTRTYDWGVMAMRLAGFEVRDCIQWVYGSGFPKSHNIEKAVNKLDGVEFEEKPAEGVGFMKADSEDWNVTKNQLIQKGKSSERAKQWEGWGSALKPANEPIVLARKPLEKGLSIAENVLKWGTGGINIDGCRVGYKEDDHVLKYEGYSNGKYQSEYEQGTSYKHGNQVQINKQGRFPANFIMTHHPDCVCVGTKKVGNGKEGGYNYKGNNYQVEGFVTNNSPEANSNYGEETIDNWNCHEDCPIRIMDEQSGVLNKQGVSKTDNKSGWQNEYVGGNEVKPVERKLYLDKGGASRFFLNTKSGGNYDFFMYIYDSINLNICGNTLENQKVVGTLNGVTLEIEKFIQSVEQFMCGNKPMEICQEDMKYTISTLTKQTIELKTYNVLKGVNIDFYTQDLFKTINSLMELKIGDVNVAKNIKNLMNLLLEMVEHIKVIVNLVKNQNCKIGENEIENTTTSTIESTEINNRFFYCAKASKKERNKGLNEFEEKIIKGRDEGQDKLSVAYKPRPTPMANVHPTVKPISLMRYLVRLITPPNGIVLDPFNGSGTTGIACKLEGMNYVGMELDAEYCKIAQARIDNFTESDLEYEVEELNEDAQTNESEQKDNEDDNLDTQLSLF